MNYNTEPQLWVNLLKAERAILPLSRNSLFLVEGQVIHGNEVIGRFEDNGHATTVLMGAGWQRNQTNQGIWFTA